MTSESLSSSPDGGEAPGSALPNESGGEQLPEQQAADPATQTQESADQPVLPVEAPAGELTENQPEPEAAEPEAAEPEAAEPEAAEPEAAEPEAAEPEAAEPEAAEPEAAEPEAAEPEAAEPEAAEPEAAGSGKAAAGKLKPAPEPEDESLRKDWYILKVQVNREDSIRDALERRVKIADLEEFFGEIVVPVEDVAEFNKSGKRRVVKKKLYPGYIMVNMSITDDTWFLVRETPGIGDFTGSAGKPTPMEPHEVNRIIRTGEESAAGEGAVKTAIPFKPGDRVRVKEGYFENFEGDVETVDEANGRVTIMINIFGRSTPVELEHWQVEAV